MTTDRLPVIGEFVRGSGTLIAIEKALPEPPPPPPREDYIFAEITARAEIRCKGEIIKCLSTFNDFYGKETSIAAAKNEAEGVVARLNLGNESDLELVVVKITTQYRMRPTHSGNVMAPGIVKFVHLDFGSRRELPEETKEVVWSSKQEGVKS